MTDAIFDAPSLFARAWYSVSKDFVDKNGVLRSALQTVFSILNQDTGRIPARIDRVLFCWDGRSHGRDKGRSAKPEAYHETMVEFKNALSFVFGDAHAVSEQHEADDVVASAVARSESEDVYVVSSDKDLMQLQADSVHYFCLNIKGLLSRPFIINKFGVKHPQQIAIAQAVLGDRVDNIPGIKGWGPKKVKTLFESVTTEMGFADALSAIERQIPDCHLGSFYSSLDRTLLDYTIKGLQKPVSIALMPEDQIADIGVNGIEDAYSRLLYSYSGKRSNRQELPDDGMNEYDA